MITLEEVAKTLANAIEFEVYDTLRDKQYRVICLRKHYTDTIQQVVLAFNDEDFCLEVQQKLFDKDSNILKEQDHHIKINVEIDKDSAIHVDTNEPVDPAFLKKQSIEHASKIWLGFVFQNNTIKMLAEKIKQLVITT